MEDPVIGRVRQIIADTGELQQVVAERIGIDPTKLTKSLNGQRRFTSLELALLAQLGRRSVDWLLSGTPSRSWTFAHRLTTLDADSANQAGAEAAKEVARFHEGLTAMGYINPPSDRPTPPALSSYFVGAGNALAEWAVGQLGLQLRHTTTAELISRVEQVFGVDVVITELPAGCDGMSYQDGDLRVIVLAATERSARQRYTLGHELGHILAGDAEHAVIRENVDSGKTNEERRANVFAASFLAPTEEVKEALAEPGMDIERATWEFGISPVSFSWRLLNLGLIDKHDRLALASKTTAEIAAGLGQITTHLERDRASLSHRAPLRLLAGYVRAFFDGQATLKPVAAMLDISLDTAYDIFAATSTEGPSGNPEQGEE